MDLASIVHPYYDRGTLDLESRNTSLVHRENWVRCASSGRNLRGTRDRVGCLADQLPATPRRRSTGRCCLICDGESGVGECWAPTPLECAIAGARANAPLLRSVTEIATSKRPALIHDLDVIHKSLNRNRAGHRVIVSGPVGVESGTIAALDDVNTAFGEIAAQKVLENGSGGLRRASVYQEAAKTGERGSSGEHRRQIEAPLKETIDGNGGSAAKLRGVR